MNTQTTPYSKSTDFDRSRFRFSNVRPQSLRPLDTARPPHSSTQTTVPVAPSVEVAPPACCPYSERQLEILQLLAEGFSSAQVAEVLEISTETVRTHRQHILQRTDRRNMVSLIVQAVRQNWI